ncbi:MAG: substrate-binding domain-containing protein [Luteolibacter sp.]
MKPIRLFSAAEQVAAHLRDEILRGGLVHRLPGVHQLAAELGVNHKTVAAALHLLEQENLLVPQGSGRSRRILIPRGTKPPVLRVGILPHDAESRRATYFVELLHELTELGHTVVMSPKSLQDMKMDVRRIESMVKHYPADVWLVIAGSREVLEWLSRRSQPALAIFGRRRGVPIAAVGPDKPFAMAEATRELIRLGHRQIVLLTRTLRRLPLPGATELAFLRALVEHGVVPGDYHLPEWFDRIEFLFERLDSYFTSAPPTAMIVDEVPLYLAVQQYLFRRGIRVPEDVSLVCTDHSPNFELCQPTVAHIHWDSRPMRKRVLQWVANASRGKSDIRQTLTPAEFVPGGSIGPVKVV